MHRDQRGVGIVEILLISVILGSITAVGTYVYLQRGKDGKIQSITNFDQCKAAGYPIMESYPEQCAANGQTFARILSSEEKKNSSPQTANWKVFDGEGFSLGYPNNWRQFKPEMGAGSTASFVSEDFVAADGLGASVSAGYWLEVFVSSTEANGEDVAPASFSSYDAHMKYLQGDQACGGDYHASSIDGLPAIISTIKCHGSYEEAYVYKNSKEYQFRLYSPDEKKPEAKELLKNILSTVVLD